MEVVTVAVPDGALSGATVRTVATAVALVVQRPFALKNSLVFAVAAVEGDLFVSTKGAVAAASAAVLLAALLLCLRL